MAFQQYKFENLDRNRIGNPIISITSAGTISFTKSVTQNCELYGKYVELFYDLEVNKIGIKIVNEPTEYSLEIKESGNCSYVACGSFFRFFDIPKPGVGNTFKQQVVIDLINEGQITVLNYPNKR